MPARLVLALLVSCCPLAACGAPVPPPPRLTADLLVGAWGRYDVGGMEGGRITFYADGTYRAQHEDDGPWFVGLWWTDGATLVMVEYALRDGDPWLAPVRHEVALSARDYPTVRGTNTAGSPVVLSDPVRGATTPDTGRTRPKMLRRK